MAKKIVTLLFFACVLFFFSQISHDSLQKAPSLVPSPSPTQIPTQSVTPPASPSAVLGEKNLEWVTVTEIADGDTVKLSNGRTLRYIGIDTPETVDPRRAVGCFGKEASSYNRELVLNKTVGLEKDVSETDRYGRLLRYVYLEEGRMVNEVLVREGYAYASAYPPDVKYQEMLENAETDARENGRGLWGSCGITVSPTIDPSTFICDCTKSCSQLTSCQEATYQLKNCGCKNLDGNNDGIACNSLCR